MDPIGFSLENFDALGRWRTTSDGVPIDASASLPDGSRFEGVAGLREHVGTRDPSVAPGAVQARRVDPAVGGDATHRG